MREFPEKQAPSTFVVFFGHELRRYRTAAGLSLDQLGTSCNYTGAFVGLVEQAKRSCPRDLAERSDTMLDARGALLGLWEQAHQEAHPGWFQPFVKAEAEATAISEYESLVISGLLQTEEYATEVIGAGCPEAADEEIRHEVASRLSRRTVLDREMPPRFWLILDEAALRRVIGSPKIMFDQLMAVVDAAKRPRVTVQVLPFSVGAHACLAGTLTVLEGKYKTAYCAGHASGRLITDPEEVAECGHAFNLLQSSALSVRDSLDLIHDVMEGYGP